MCLCEQHLMPNSVSEIVLTVVINETVRNDLAIENKNAIWVRKLFPASVITVTCSSVMNFLHQWQPFFISISRLWITIYYNASFQRWY